MTSIIEEQRKAIIGAIKSIQNQTPNTWRCVVMDMTSRSIILNVLKADNILDELIVDISNIEDKRTPNPTREAIYILVPEEHIVRCLITDYDRPTPRYKGAHLLWTSELDDRYRRMLIQSPARRFIMSEKVLNVDFYPKESHLFTTRDPLSFYYLYNPECRSLVTDHLRMLGQKIASACITLQENPVVRYYKPSLPNHEARVLSEYLAKEVQNALDFHRRMDPSFPPQSSRPQSVLFIVDRSMDLAAPIMHEFTYQAMAYDLIKLERNSEFNDVYKTEVNTDEGPQVLEMELKEDDKVWVEYRHTHMKDTGEKLSAEFNQFLKDNKYFVDKEAAKNVHALKEMVANMNQFSEEKNLYTLHLSMADDCMKIFNQYNLLELGIYEQTLATGFNEERQPPKNVTDQLVRMLDDPLVGASDRLRLIILYILWRDGVIEEDIQKLIFHSQLGRHDETIVKNLDLLGARMVKSLKEPPRQLPKRKPPPPKNLDEGEIDLSRYSTAVKTMLEDYIKQTMDPAAFPFTRPDMALSASKTDVNAQPASLRTARPTWSRRQNAMEPRQRIFVFLAGGATYSEARDCYELSKAHNRDIYLGSSHMLTPEVWLGQLQRARTPRRTLQLPEDGPRTEVPRHLLEPDPVPKPNPPAQGNIPAKAPTPQPAQVQVPPVKEMNSLKVSNTPYYVEEEKKKKKRFWR